MAEIDFEAEGLLKGLRGRARAGRRQLLAELAAAGVSLDELKRAVAEGRLALLLVERVLSGDGRRHTAEEIASTAGLERDFLERQWRALGMALAEDDEAIFTERDLEAAKRVAALRQAGLPDEGILEIARLLGMTMAQLAAANRRLVADALIRPGDTELEVARRFAAAAEGFTPMIAESLAYTFNLHLREQIRHDAIDTGELGAGSAAGAQKITVCFADMTGFTRLGESLPPEELGRVSGRLAELASEVASSPVRVVKMIGDAAMLVGPDTRGVLEAALAMVEASGRQGDEEMPLLRAGVASGPALPRGGDYYGRSVNLASRITDIARPGSVLATEKVRDAVGEDGYRWSFARARQLKGIESEVKLWRCRRDDGSAEHEEEDARARGSRAPRRRRARRT